MRSSHQIPTLEARGNQSHHALTKRRILPRSGRGDMMIAMSGRNECAEYQRLQQVYEDAVIMWEQDRIPNIVPIDRHKLSREEAVELRDQALSKRNIAANELYTHLKNCPTCKHFKK